METPIDDSIGGLEALAQDRRVSRRGFLGFCAATAASLMMPSIADASINRKVRLSPRDPVRPYLQSFDYIILHTTESSSSSGALSKLRRRGEAHYMVDFNGDVYQMMHESRLAKHAGRSMWEGRTNVSKYSIGIEVAGFHNREPTRAQYDSLKELIADIQKRRGISDNNVITHSAVAYGTPNRWHHNNHRGRKRCGMIFGRDRVRRRLGLTRKPAYDPDVLAGRLKAADPFLAKVLYGGEKPVPTTDSKIIDNIITDRNTAWNIAGRMYDADTTTYRFPDGTEVKGDKVKDFTDLPDGTKVVMGKHEKEVQDDDGIRYFQPGDTAFKFAGNEYDSDTTIYFLTNGKIRQGDYLKRIGYDFGNIPEDTGILVGYVYGGHVKPWRSAWSICQKQCRSPYTYFRFPDGQLKNGDEIDDGRIPSQTLVLFKE